jgi:hypothetical protein
MKTMYQSQPRSSPNSEAQRLEGPGSAGAPSRRSLKRHWTMQSLSVKCIRTVLGAALLLPATLAPPKAACVDLAEPPAVEWQVTFGEPDQYERALYVEDTLDGGFIILAAHGKEGHVCGTQLVKMDPSGNVEWTRSAEKMFCPHSYAGTKPLCTMRDGGFAALGLADDYWVSHVYRLDPQGQLLWDQTTEAFGPGKPVPLLAIQETIDGNIIACGCHGEDVRALLVKMDQATGQILWWRVYGEELPHSPLLDAVFFFVEPTSDGGYIAAGSHDLNNIGYLLKTDELGAIEWSRTLADDRPPAEELATLSWVHQTGVSGYVMFGQSSSAGNYVFATDADGKFEWVRYPLDYLWNGVPAPTIDGGYAFITANGTSLSKIDALGNDAWTTPAGLTRIIRSVHQTKDAGYVVAGWSPGNSEKEDIYLAKLAPDLPRSAFARGDADASGELDITDAVVVLSYLFQSGPAPTCQDAADSDDNGKVNITDPIYVLGHLFLGGPAPTEPSGKCGADPTEDRLTCEAYGACR